MNSKRMFEVKEVDGKTRIYVNSSSLSLMQECQRKANYILNDKLVSESSSHQDFGTLVHAVLARWYLSNPKDRSPEMMEAAWNDEFTESGFIPVDDRKNHATGLSAMRKYAEIFAHDPFVIVSGKDGPIVEKTLEAKVADLPAVNAEVWLFGTIDALVTNEDAPEDGVYVMDHKTTTTLGAQFANLWKPNHQMSAYILLAQANGFNCNTALVQGLQIVKTKQEVIRIETRRTREELNDFLDTLVYEVSRFLHNTKANFFPGASAYTCSSFSGCQFLDYCQASQERRRELVNMKQQELELMKNGKTVDFGEARTYLANAL